MRCVEHVRGHRGENRAAAPTIRVGVRNDNCVVPPRATGPVPSVAASYAHAGRTNAPTQNQGASVAAEGADPVTRELDDVPCALARQNETRRDRHRQRLIVFVEAVVEPGSAHEHERADERARSISRPSPRCQRRHTLVESEPGVVGMPCDEAVSRSRSSVAGNVSGAAKNARV